MSVRVTDHQDARAARKDKNWSCQRRCPGKSCSELVGSLSQAKLASLGYQIMTEARERR